MCALIALLAACGGSGATWTPLTGAAPIAHAARLDNATPTPATASTPVNSQDAFATERPTAHALAGPDAWAWRATMPGARLVVYYGIDGSPDAGVIGSYGDDENGLLQQLRSQTQAYAQLDPTHVTMSGLDVVDPVPQPSDLNGQCVYVASCVSRVAPDRIQHFVDLTGRNHMLFWLDAGIGHSTVQTEMTYLLPYLYKPWVNVALDPEWDLTYGGQHGSGIVGNGAFGDTGYMRASEINYVIDQLSALVIANHLPPKILIIHQFQMCEDPGATYLNPDNPYYLCDARSRSTIEAWKNIKVKPGVQVVINADGVGFMADKLIIYRWFESAQHFAYPGFKLFYFYPQLTSNFYDQPLMTPAQVLQMNPSPLLIMYQ